MLLVDNPNPTPRLSLHWAVTECLAVSGVFAAAKCLHLQGRQADTDAVEAALADHAVWHFATHGAGGWNDAMDGHLLLADEQKLTVRQLLGLRVNARLAVLSACETSVPGLELPDEVVSLPTAMIQAGAAGVVGSLWSVDDLSTALLMIRFYIAWRKEGCDPPQALAVAQRWLRESSNAEFAAYFDPQNSQDGADYRAAIPLRVMTRLSGEFKPYTQDERPFEHPYFWAGFCYTGV
jgi:CHAT domain-containing protein